MPLDVAQLEIFAQELAALAIDIEAIGSALCADPAVVETHLTSLQSIDLIAQRQRALGGLLLAEDLKKALIDCSLARIADLFHRQSA